MTSPPPSPADAAVDSADAAELARLGYKQQLLRGLGGFGNFAVSFSVISILTGAVTLYGWGMRYGGPFGVVAGWTLVSLGTLPVAASLAQLASSFPTAGALYHWASFLGGRGTGWLTAWLNLVGQFAITAGIDWGLTEFLVPRAPLGVRVVVFAAVLGSHGLLNHVGIRAVNLLSRVSAWYHLVGVFVLVGAVATLAPHRPLATLLERTTLAGADTGGFGGYGYAFLVSLLMAGYTFTGYDASAHVSEETHDAARTAPRGIFLSVVVSAVCGAVLLVAVTLSIKDPARVAAPDAVGFAEALEQAFATREGGAILARALTYLAMGAMWFCGLASLTSNSRMIFAFARDGGMPLHATWARVSDRWKTPVPAIWLSVAGALGVALLCVFWGQLRHEPAADVLGKITAASTVGLYLSYGLPIAVGLRARLDGRWTERGPWDLGRASHVTNAIALAWIAFLCCVSCLPPNGFVGWLFSSALVGLAGYWYLWMRRRFTGPPVAHRRQPAQ